VSFALLESRWWVLRANAKFIQILPLWVLSLLPCHWYFLKIHLNHAWLLWVDLGGGVTDWYQSMFTLSLGHTWCYIYEWMCWSCMHASCVWPLHWSSMCLLHCIILIMVEVRLSWVTWCRFYGMHRLEYMTGYTIICNFIKFLYVGLDSWLFHYMHWSCRLITRIDRLYSTTCGYVYVWLIRNCLCRWIVAWGNVYTRVMVVLMNEVIACIVDMALHRWLDLVIMMVMHWCTYSYMSICYYGYVLHASHWFDGLVNKLCSPSMLRYVDL